MKLSKMLEKRMLEDIVSKDYGLRGKSKWIEEAVRGFLQISDYPTMVDIADEMENFEKVVSIRLPKDLMLEIEEALIIVRHTYPALEGVKSKIFRASILQRLIGNPSIIYGDRT